MRFFVKYRAPGSKLATIAMRTTLAAANDLAAFYKNSGYIVTVSQPKGQRKEATMKT